MRWLRLMRAVLSWVVSSFRDGGATTWFRLRQPLELEVPIMLWFPVFMKLVYMPPY